MGFEILLLFFWQLWTTLNNCKSLVLDWSQFYIPAIRYQMADLRERNLLLHAKFSFFITKFSLSRRPAPDSVCLPALLHLSLMAMGNYCNSRYIYIFLCLFQLDQLWNFNIFNFFKVNSIACTVLVIRVVSKDWSRSRNEKVARGLGVFL